MTVRVGLQEISNSAYLSSKRVHVNRDTNLPIHPLLPCSGWPLSFAVLNVAGFSKVSHLALADEFSDFYSSVLNRSNATSSTHTMLCTRLKCCYQEWMQRFRLELIPPSVVSPSCRLPPSCLTSQGHPPQPDGGFIHDSFGLSCSLACH